MRGYQELIHKTEPNYDPRHIEAFMRCEHPTLDGLSREQFVAEVHFCAKCVDEAGIEASEMLAESFGL